MAKTPNRFAAMKPRQRGLVVVGSLSVILILLFALAEGAIRVRQIIKHGSGFKGIEDFYHVDEKLNLRVPVAGLQTDRLKISGLGFRSPEIPVAKPAGTIRVAFLGASTTFCASLVGNESIWPSKVMRQLSAQYPDQKFDFINGGVPGYLMRHSLTNLEHRVGPLEPDIIVIYHAANDLSQNTGVEAGRQGWQAEHKGTASAWLARYSMLYYLVEKNVVTLMAQSKAANQVNETAQAYEISTAAVSKPFEDDLRRLVEKAKEVADQVVLVTFTTHIRQEQPSEKRAEAAVTAFYYMPFMSLQGLIDHYAAYNQVIREVGRSTGSLVIGGEHDIPGTAEHFTDSVHFTQRGSDLMAQRVGKALIAADIVEKMRLDEAD